MIGLTASQSIPLAAAVPVATLHQADQAYASLARDFFTNEGWKFDISQKDRFIRAIVPLTGEEDSHGFLRTLGNVQGLLKGRVSLVHTDPASEALTASLGFPFPSLLMGLLTLLYGPQAMTPTLLSRDVGRDEINRMYFRNEQPVGVFDRSVFLGDLGTLVHPFLFMYHDLYHLVFGSALPLPLRRHWSALYDVVNGLPEPLKGLRITDRLLDCLTDNDVDASAAESADFLAFIPFRAVVESIQEAYRSDDEDEARATFRESEKFLGALVDVLEAVNDPVFLCRDFIMRQLRDLHEQVATQVAIRDVLTDGLF